MEHLVLEGTDLHPAASFLLAGRPYTVTFRTPLEARMDLRTTCDWVIRPRLLKLPGTVTVRS